MSNKKSIRKIAGVMVAVIITWAAIFSSIGYANGSKLNMSFIYFGNSSYYTRQVKKTNNSLQVISPNYFNLSKDGGLLLTNAIDSKFVKEMHDKNVKVIPFLSNHWNRELGRNALENKEELAKDIYEMIEKYNLDGVNIDIENLTEKDRDDYTEFVKLINEKLPESKTLSISVAPNPYGVSSGWQGSYDYEKLSKYSDYLVIMTYDESYPGGPEGPVASLGFVENSILNALTQVPKDKIVLGIPFFGRFWDENGNVKGRGISLKKVNELIEKYDSEILYDETKQSPKVIIEIDKDDEIYMSGKRLEPEKYNIWYENDESIKRKLRLVQKYDLKGSASWSLGQENESVWDYYSLWLNGQYFKDIQNHWAGEQILNMELRGWMKGTSNITFSPHKTLTRAQGAVILVRALGLEEKAYDLSSFRDVGEAYWAKNEIEIAAKHGIAYGYEDGSYRPEQSITREEMAVMVGRILKDLKDISANEPLYNDVEKNRWSFEIISRMTNNGVFNGFEDNTFRPTENITRAQMAALMDRIADDI